MPFSFNELQEVLLIKVLDYSHAASWNTTNMNKAEIRATKAGLNNGAGYRLR